MSDGFGEPDWITRLQQTMVRRFPAAPRGRSSVDQGGLRLYRWWSGDSRDVWIDIVDEGNAHIFAAGGGRVRIRTRPRQRIS